MSKIVHITPNRARVAAALGRSRSPQLQQAAVDRRTAVNINAAAGSNVHLHFHQHGEAGTRSAAAPEEAPYEVDAEELQARREFEIAMGIPAGSTSEEDWQRFNRSMDRTDAMLGLSSRTALPVDPLADFGARGARTAGKAHPAVRTSRFR